ncbi:MAG: hypothetical protein RL161_1074 [Bacteroidota bacterium]|jgi:hypothetical protein
MVFLQDGNVAGHSACVLDRPRITDIAGSLQAMVCLMVVGTRKSVDGTALLRDTLRDYLRCLVDYKRRLTQPMGEE